MKTSCLIYSILLVSLLITNGCSSIQPVEATRTKIVAIESPILPTVTSVIPTESPIPTLSVESIREKLIYFLQKNDACSFPCIWGLVPGMSTEDRERLFNQYSEVSAPDFYSNTLFYDEFNSASLIAQFINENTTVYTDLTTHEKNETVEILLLRMEAVNTDDLGKSRFGDAYYTELTQYYQLPDVLLNYGQPSNVLFAAWQLDPIMKAPYNPISLVLIYADLDAMVEYIFPSELVSENLVGCPTGAKINLFSWSPASDLSLEEIVDFKSGDEGIIPLSLGRFKAIEELTSLSLEEFYQLFQSSEECISTPAKLWPPS